MGEGELFYSPVVLLSGVLPWPQGCDLQKGFSYFVLFCFSPFRHIGRIKGVRIGYFFSTRLAKPQQVRLW